MPKKTKADPTGQAVNRNKSTRTLNRRLNRAEGEVKALFRSLPKTSRRQTKIVNADQTTIYSYDYNEAAFNAAIVFILNQELLETQTGIIPFDWYWKSDIEIPYRQGTVEEIRDFNQLLLKQINLNGLPASPVLAERILLSEPYRTALNNVYVSNFNTIKTLSDRVASQVAQQINVGVQAGDTPTSIANDISQRFNVGRSDAKRIANTEINKAYNDARLNATEILADETGLRSAVIHISALSTTTRVTHAARHGNVYNVADQLQWWNRDANRINCKCTTRTVLIDKQGKVIDAELQEEIKEEGEDFFSNT